MSNIDWNEILEKVVHYIKLAYTTFWNFLESLPIPPEQTLGITAGVIVFIWLVTCCICCRFCRPKEEKAEVPGKLDLRKNHLFGPNYRERTFQRVDEMDYNIEATQFDALSEIKLAQIRYTVDFDQEESIAIVTVHECKDLPPEPEDEEAPDPYVEVKLKPAAKKSYKTKVKNNNHHPKFEETFNFKKIIYNGFKMSDLIFRVMHDDFGKDDLLGEAIVSIKDLDMSKGKVTKVQVLAPEFKSEAKVPWKDTKLGHICIGLGYAPNSSVLAVFILSCKNLAAVDDSGFSDPYVTFFLIRDGKKIKKRKTTFKTMTLNPTFNASFAFEASYDDLDELSLLFCVADYDKGEPGEPIGQCVIGQLGNTDLGAVQWKNMMDGPNKPWLVWHMLRPIPPKD
ncbi:synaptotagmin-1-like [Clytia hemisphaerica]|uniref:synaptotagmin-1-like n=1 Tax=Clytia hemisphaerica TaxID=252671 RepID=UPI0034D3F3AF|eukprot:TCONS_00004949-protein